MIPDPSFGFVPVDGTLENWQFFNLWARLHDYRYGRSLTFFPPDSYLSPLINVSGVVLDYRFACFEH